MIFKIIFYRIYKFEIDIKPNNINNSFFLILYNLFTRSLYKSYKSKNKN